MENKIRLYIDGLFANTLPTRKSVELKEEMIQNLQDKYNDLIAEGKTEEAAYNIAIAGIGDISHLLAELEAESEPLAYTVDIQEVEKARTKSAMLTAIAVMLYILSPLPLIILGIVIDGGNMNENIAGLIGLPSLFILLAAATGLLIYNNMTKHRGLKRKDTLVEEFREWQSDEKDRKAMRRAISSALWTIIVALYFVISFMTLAWHITWIIFLLGGAIESLINVFLTLKKK